MADGLYGLARFALQIGLPVIVKPSGGGGGIGMKVVEREADLVAAVESSANSARAAFGDATVYVEKYVRNPRHVEVQVIDEYVDDACNIAFVDGLATVRQKSIADWRFPPATGTPERVAK